MHNEEKYWNKPIVIKWFSEQPVPDYWVTFFSERQKQAKVLDLGCGAGRNTQFLIESGHDVYACDGYDGMVKATRARLYKLGLKKAFVDKRVIKASMLKLPYGDSFYDIVLSNGVFHNVSSLEEMQRAFNEASRVLKRGGFICFNLFSSRHIDPSLKRISDSLYITKEKLPMVLISKSKLIKFFRICDFYPTGSIIEYDREVTTGKRSVMRGVFKKI